MREQMSRWLRRPVVLGSAIVAGTVLAVIVVPELLRLGGVEGASATVIRMGSALFMVAGAFALLWFTSAPVRRVIDEERRRGNLTYLVRPSMPLGAQASSRWTAEGPAAILVAGSEGVTITRAGHQLVVAGWSQVGSWDAVHGNTVTFRVNGARHRIQLLDHRWLYPVSRARAARMAEELTAVGSSARAA